MERREKTYRVHREYGNHYVVRVVHIRYTYRVFHLKRSTPLFPNLFVIEENVSSEPYFVLGRHICFNGLAASCFEDFKVTSFCFLNETIYFSSAHSMIIDVSCIGISRLLLLFIVSQKLPRNYQILINVLISFISKVIFQSVSHVTCRWIFHVVWRKIHSFVKKKKKNKSHLEISEDQDVALETK